MVRSLQKQPLLWVQQQNFAGLKTPKESVKLVHICHHLTGPDPLWVTFVHQVPVIVQQQVGYIQTTVDNSFERRFLQLDY